MDTSATLIANTDTSAAVTRIKNTGSNSVFLGASGVTTSTGYELVADGEVKVVVSTGDEVYGITNTGTSVVHVLQV